MQLENLLEQIRPLDQHAMSQAQILQNNLIKPAGSLGTLEQIAIQISGITGLVKNSVSRKLLMLFGSDHGIYDEGVSSAPQIFTAKLMRAYALDKNAAINILAQNANSELQIFDLGVKNLPENSCTNIISRKFMPNGSNNFAKSRAIPSEIVHDVIKFGVNLVREAKSQDVKIIGTGEVGMGNTSPAAACILAATNSRDENFIGRGAGLSDEKFALKKSVILNALKFHEKNLRDPFEIISCVGGLDIAAMTGVFLGGAIFRIPIVIDGVISISAALLASKIATESVNFMIPSHVSQEPAFKLAIQNLALKISPFLNLQMRLGEGSGCAIAFQVIDQALAIINNMQTFQSF